MGSYGENIEAAMSIEDQGFADAMFELLVLDRVNQLSESREAAEEGVRYDLGYQAGYYSSETRRRVERLFSCEHPIFGSIEEFGEPTPEEAFGLGMEAARLLKEKEADDQG